ncbi:MAG: hypothetical protein AAGA53_10000 [Pseudomonadota bacterium]
MEPEYLPSFSMTPEERNLILQIKRAYERCKTEEERRNDRDFNAALGTLKNLRKSILNLLVNELKKYQDTNDNFSSIEIILPEFSLTTVDETIGFLCFTTYSEVVEGRHSLKKPTGYNELITELDGGDQERTTTERLYYDCFARKIKLLVRNFEDLKAGASSWDGSFIINVEILRKQSS